MTNGSGVIELDPIVERILAELKRLEQDVAEKDAALRTARELLAAERGKLDLLAELQRSSIARTAPALAP